MLNILYIEDDPNLQRTIRRSLERGLDASVTVAGDAPTAIKILEAADKTFGCFHFDHIISDFDLLNGTSGADVFAWIMARDGEHKNANDNGEMKTTRQVYLERFLFMTSRTEEALALHNRFVEKPATADSLRKALATRGPVDIRCEPLFTPSE